MTVDPSSRGYSEHVHRLPWPITELAGPSGSQGIDVGGTIRSVGQSVPSKGTGLELQVDPAAPQAWLSAYNRTTSTTIPLEIQASSLLLPDGAKTGYLWLPDHADPGAAPANGSYLFSSSSDGHIYRHRTGQSATSLIDALTALGGALSGTLPSPSIANGALNNSNQMNAGFVVGSHLSSAVASAAYPAFYSSGPSGGISTSSTSFVNTDLSHSSIAWTAGQVGLWICHLQVQNTTTNTVATIGLNISGVGTTTVGAVTCPLANTDFPITCILPLSLSQGTYTFVVQIKTNAGTCAINAANGNYSYIINPRP